MALEGRGSPPGRTWHHEQPIYQYDDEVIEKT